MKDRLAEIFTRQLEYYNSLRPVVELENGLLFWEYPLTWNDREQQEHLRVLAWRLTEELIEVINSETREEALEEYADCLHFLIEISLASGVTECELFSGIENSKPVEGQDYLSMIFTIVESEPNRTSVNSILVLATINALGQAMHHLRQRPWRREDRPSDRKAFVLGLHFTFLAFICACCNLFSSDEIYQAYFRKSRINDERQAGTAP
jgi:dimeric dUTPase (all-alpha-NTP-PPase superfamily)